MHAQKHTAESSSIVSNESHDIFITLTDQFKEHFGQFGPVIDANIMMDHNSGRSRGFGWVAQGDVCLNGKNPELYNLPCM